MSAVSAAGDFPIAVIGAGFAGIGAAIRLKAAGIRSFTIFERADEIGGTWRDNTYPGCACDVPSHVYSFSFEQNPDWTHAYAPGEEIQRYLLGCVERHGLRAHLRLRTAITAARFEPEAGRWLLETSAGDTVAARVVIAGLGGLVDPAYPDIPGLEAFAGAMFHTARWNHACDLRGRRVAVIGTGASAVQVVPAIAPVVDRLTVFQRTAPWVMPRRDRLVSERTRRLFAQVPAVQTLYRWLLFAVSEAMGPIVFLDSPLSKLGEWASLRHLERSVSDPELRRKLTPSFRFGCKRVLVSDDYWPTFERPNVALVTDPIRAVERTGVVTDDGRLHPADVIVLATGFKLGLASAPFPITGLEGLTLDRAWGNGAVAYKGVTVSGFPNWFTLMGPNTGPGHTSVLVYTERQIEYALQAIRLIRRENLAWVDVRREVMDAYNAGLQRRMRYMSWTTGCTSWYLGPDGVNRALYPGFASEYCVRLWRFRPEEYRLQRRSPGQARLAAA